MPDGQGPAITFRELGPADASAVFELYYAVQAQTPYGFLSQQTPESIAEVLGRPRPAACVGAWHGKVLAGYLINTLETEIAGADSPLVRHLSATGEPVMYNRGIAILPELRALGIASALIRERRKLAAARGLRHALMLVAQDNVASLQLTTQLGSWLVGFERDSLCQNFQVYAGALTGTATLANEVALPLGDEEAISANFADGWISDTIDPDRGLVIMRRCRELAGS